MYASRDGAEAVIQDAIAHRHRGSIQNDGSWTPGRETISSLRPPQAMNVRNGILPRMRCLGAQKRRMNDGGLTIIS